MSDHGREPGFGDAPRSPKDRYGLSGIPCRRSSGSM